jgi:predicted N-formylglutamate amidohydrolase
MSEPFHIISGPTHAPLFFFGDHASRHIPARYADLGLSGDDLTRHIAWDIGTEDVIRGLCARFGAPGLVAGFSRLLIDPNRSEDMADLIPPFSDGTDIPGNAGLDAATKSERIETLYQPYHAQLSAQLDAMTALPLTLSVHSFTPKPDLGARRTLDLGLLVKADVPNAEKFGGALRQVAPQFSLGMNEPYSAYDLNHTIDSHVAPRDLPHLAIEIRQDHIHTQDGVARMVSILGDALDLMLET